MPVMSDGYCKQVLLKTYLNFDRRKHARAVNPDGGEGGGI
jgi:hypothetical protein